MRFHITPTKSAEYAAGFSVGTKMVEVYADHPEDAWRKLWTEHYDEIMEVIKHENAESAKERYQTSQALIRDENVRSVLHSYTKSIIEKEYELSKFVTFKEEFQEGQAIFLAYVRQYQTEGSCPLWVLNASKDDLKNAMDYLADMPDLYASRVLLVDKDMINSLPFQSITMAGRKKIKEIADEHRRNVAE